jgi:hypothetical protein
LGVFKSENDEFFAALSRIMKNINKSSGVILTNTENRDKIEVTQNEIGEGSK